MGGIVRSSALSVPRTTWADATVGPAQHHPQCRSRSKHRLSRKSCQLGSSCSRQVLRQQLALGCRRR